MRSTQFFVSNFWNILSFIWILVSGDLDEEDSCPPDLESVEPVVSQNQQVEINQQQRTTAQQDFVNLDTDSELLRNLAIAIKVTYNFIYIVRIRWFEKKFINLYADSATFHKLCYCNR